MSSFVGGRDSHVSSNTTTNQPHAMTSANTHAPSTGSQPGLCPTDGEAIVPKPGGDSKKISKQSWDYVARSGIAGGLASCAAKTVVAPLDRVKILFQANNPKFEKYIGSWSGAVKAIRDIHRSSGVGGLFRGHSATLLRIFPYGGIKFLAYEQIRGVVIPTRDHETPVRRFMAGSLAGIASVFCTYPLEVIRVRLAWETKSSKRVTVRQICRKIYLEQPPELAPPTSNLPRAAGAPIEAAQAVVRTIAPTATQGLTNFFRGFVPTLCGMVPYAGASFLTHDAAGDFMRLPFLYEYTVLPLSERSQKQLAPNKPPPLRAWAELCTGAIAGFVGQTVSYPLEVIRRRMQVGGVVGDGHRLSMVEVASDIARSKGYKGFFVGLGIGYVKVVPMAATSFYVYERMKITFGI